MNAERTRPTAGIARGRPLMVDLLSLLFRYATPVLAILCATGRAAWWIVLVPIFPVWWSFVTSTHAAHTRARTIRRPKRQVGIDEATSEVRFHSATAALDAAVRERTMALLALAEARAIGAREAQHTSRWRPGWWRRGET